MEEKLYHEAALHAANSPHGILRTMETMQRFIGELFFSFDIVLLLIFGINKKSVSNVPYERIYLTNRVKASIF